MDSAEIIRRCGLLAQLTGEPASLTRHDLTPPASEARQLLRGWMETAGMETRVDAAGNLRGVYGRGPRLMIGSHIDTVPNTGPFEGVLGLLLGIALVEERPRCAVEVAAFDGEGLDPSRLPDALLSPEVKGYLEFDIEQGPALDCLGLPLGVVEAIAGISRWDLRFEGQAGHAGAPMDRRRDALAGAAEWIGLVEHVGLTTRGLIATVGRIETWPGAVNVIPGRVETSLDVRHELDEVRERAREILLDGAGQIVERRGLKIEGESRREQPAAALDFEIAERAVEAAGYPVHRMVSGAGYDSMILAQKVPASMILLRNPGGSVRPGDVDAALAVGSQLLRAWRG